MNIISMTRHSLAATLLAALTAMTAACTQDVYDKGDSELSLMRADFVEAHVGPDKRVDYVTTDDDIQLPLATPFTTSWIQQADTTYRAVLYYNYTDRQAEPLSLARVSTTSIHRPANFKGGAKTDPLGLESVWVSTNRRYLNLCVILKTGTADEKAEAQTVGIIGDTIVTAPSGQRTYHLRLYHNQGQVPQYYSQRVYFSVPIHGLPADSLRLTVNTYDGPVTKAFSL